MGVGQGRTQAQAHLQTGGREAKNSCPAIIRMHLAVKQVVLFQRVHQVPSGHSIDSQPLCEPALVQTGLVMKGGKHRELKGREILGLSYLCEHTEAYLMKTSRQMRRHAMNGRDCCLRRTGCRNAATSRRGLTDMGNKLGHVL